MSETYKEVSNSASTSYVAFSPYISPTPWNSSAMKPTEPNEEKSDDPEPGDRDIRAEYPSWLNVRPKYRSSNKTTWNISGQ